MLLFAITCLFITKIGVAQLIADAGPDQVYCVWFDTTYIVLGGDPTASGGVEPYTYMWDVDHPWGINVFINDPTLANPLMLYPPPVDQSIVQLYLTVTDANQVISTDTVEVAFSHFMMTLGHYYFPLTWVIPFVFPNPILLGGFRPRSIYGGPTMDLLIRLAGRCVQHPNTLPTIM